MQHLRIEALQSCDVGVQRGRREMSVDTLVVNCGAQGYEAAPLGCNYPYECVD